jgi:hypothetical protein
VDHSRTPRTVHLRPQTVSPWVRGLSAQAVSVSSPSRAGATVTPAVCEWKERGMDNTFTAVVKQDGDWWIGWVEQVPGVNCREATRELLPESPRDALAAAGEHFSEEIIAV